MNSWGLNMRPIKAHVPARIACVIATLLVLLVLLVLPAGVRAGETHYLLMFGSQTIPNEPRYAHTFAVFVRESWPGPGACPGNSTLESHIISWLPQSGVVRPYALFAECGRNYSLDETLQFAHESCQRVSLWGPYQIDPELYHRGLERLAELDRGEIRYQANDAVRHPHRVCNCIRAVSAAAGGLRVRVATAAWGETASYAVLRRFRPWIENPHATCDSIVFRLGLEKHPIIYRNWEPPRSGALTGPVFRLLGGERDLEATYGPPAHRQSGAESLGNFQGFELLSPLVVD
jgi:hypothetical protein